MNHRVIKGFLSPDDLAALSQYCDEAVSADLFRSPVVPYYSGGGQDRKLIRIERMVEDFEQSTGLRLLQRCLQLIEAELNLKATLFKDKINFRHPGSDGFGAHQDAAAGWTEFCPVFHSLAIFAKDTDKHSGGFEFSVEDPNATLYPNNSGQMDLQLFESLERVDITASAGDALLFDSFAPHRSHVNRHQSVLPHVILTFNLAELGSFRNEYYAKKLAGMRAGNGGYEFTLFTFGGTQ
jgi:hypothetical protein